MKKTLLLMMAVVMLAAGCKSGRKAESAFTADEPVLDPLTAAIEKYLADTVAPGYLQGSYSIPFCNWMSTDSSNPDSVSVLGDFWVLNYVQDGDTLKTISGGNHSGRMLLCKDTDGNYTVAEFDQTADGSDNMPSAQRIFGDKFDEFAAAHANDIEREKIRARSVTDFVKRTELPVKYYQDYGWPAVEIPAE